MVNFSKDILQDILVRLPIKSVSRFRCIDKAWCKLLKSREFLKMHHKRAMEMNVKFGLMLHSRNDIYTFTYDASSSICKPSRFLRKCGIEFFGCCNGLVLLRQVDEYESHVLILWNPATNECKNIPFPTYGPETPVECIDYGIGYDYRIEDYKVVSILDLDDGYCEVQVYALKSNSWRRLENLYRVDFLIGARLIPDMARLPVDGAIYWIVDCKSRTLPSKYREVIYYFDIERERFDEMPLPNLFDKKSCVDVNLCVLGGSLCLLGFNTEVSADLWEWKLDGMTKSWTKLFTIDLRKHFGEWLIDLMPLLSLENGEIVLGLHMEAGFHIVAYDPKHDTTRTLMVHEREGSDQVCSLHASVYVGCKASLDTGSYLGEVTMDSDDDRWDCDSDDSDGDGSDYESDGEIHDDEHGSEQEDVEQIENVKKKTREM